MNFNVIFNFDVNICLAYLLRLFSAFHQLRFPVIGMRKFRYSTISRTYNILSDTESCSSGNGKFQANFDPRRQLAQIKKRMRLVLSPSPLSNAAYIPLLLTLITNYSLLLLFIITELDILLFNNVTIIKPLMKQ